MSKNDGGPAFPTKGTGYVVDYHTGQTQPFTTFHSGLSVRDYFAGQTLAGMGTWSPSQKQMDLKARAHFAYAQADAMLAAKAKP